jgi:preprotein translocase subunit SecA
MMTQIRRDVVYSLFEFDPRPQQQPDTLEAEFV